MGPQSPASLLERAFPGFRPVGQCGVAPTRAGRGLSRDSRHVQCSPPTSRWDSVARPHPLVLITPATSSTWPASRRWRGPVRRRAGAGRCAATRHRRGRVPGEPQEKRPGPAAPARPALAGSGGRHGPDLAGSGEQRGRLAPAARSVPAGALGATTSRSEANRRGHSAQPLQGPGGGTRRVGGGQARPRRRRGTQRRTAAAACFFFIFFVCDFDVESICDVNQINVICCELISCIVD
jgi:hypothetical protein